MVGKGMDRRMTLKKNKNHTKSLSEVSTNIKESLRRNERLEEQSNNKRIFT